MKEKIERSIKSETLGTPESVEDEALLGREIAETLEIVKADNAAASEAAKAVLEQGEAGVARIKFKSSEQKEAAKEKLKQTHSKIQELISEFREASYMFMKIAVFGGAILAGPNPTFTGVETPEQSIKRAKQELKVKGITSEQRRAYKFVVNDALYRAITPWGYSLDSVDGLWHNLINGPQLKTAVDESVTGTFNNRLDAWRLYLGLPQIHNTFDISEYTPPENIRAHKDTPYYFKINGFWKDNLFSYGTSDPPAVIKKIVKQGSMRSLNVVSGNYWITTGADEKGHYIAYYDRWDLDKNKTEGEKGFFGKPFELYDRLYYNPQTYESIGLEDPAIQKVTDSFTK